MSNPPSVLVVEDDEDLRAVVAMTLEMYGYRVRTAANGREALQALEAGKADIILLDMRMPVMDGWEFARRFRARNGHVPIVVVTAAADARRCAEAIGAVGWLNKPYDLDGLIERVAAQVGPGRGDQGRPSA